MSPIRDDQEIAALPQAGWYQDPEYGGQLRWWDGNRWTADRRSMPLAASSAARLELSEGDVAPAVVEMSPPARADYDRERPDGASGYPAGGYAYEGPEQEPVIAAARRRRPIYTVAGAAVGLVVVATVLIFASNSPPSASLGGSASRVAPRRSKITTPPPSSRTPTKAPRTDPKPTPAVRGDPPATPTERGPDVTVRRRAFIAALAAAPAPYQQYPGPAQRLVRLGDRQCRLSGRLSLAGSWWDVIASSGRTRHGAISPVQSEHLVVAAHQTLCPAEVTTPALAVFSTQYQLYSAAIAHIPLRSTAEVQDANLVSALSCATFDRTGQASSVSGALLAATRRYHLAIPVQDVGRVATDAIATMCARDLPAWIRYLRTTTASGGQDSGRTTARGAFLAGAELDGIPGLIVSHGRP